MKCSLLNFCLFVLLRFWRLSPFFQEPLHRCPRRTLLQHGLRSCFVSTWWNCDVIISYDSTSWKVGMYHQSSSSTQLGIASQSINQPTNQSTNQPIKSVPINSNQSTNQPLNQSNQFQSIPTKQPTNQSTNQISSNQFQPINQPTNQSTNQISSNQFQPINQPTNQSTNQISSNQFQPINQPTNQPINQSNQFQSIPTNQPINRSTNEPMNQSIKSIPVSFSFPWLFFAPIIPTAKTKIPILFARDPSAPSAPVAKNRWVCDNGRPNRGTVGGWAPSWM